MTKAIKATGFVLQERPAIFVTRLPGRWLFEHSTPSWRISDPEKGFQRIVKERRAKEIAVAVLHQKRTFPNAIVLATDRSDITTKEGSLSIPGNIKFLVVDGQHRLYSQKFSDDYEAQFACVIHTGLVEEEMAAVFLEINDNQRRVPSSLRWDLVRLVRPDDNPHEIATSELIYSLATDKESPLYQRIDLTGEQPEISLKQGSMAPEIVRIIARDPLVALDMESQFDLLVRYFTSIRLQDTDGWAAGKTPFYKARVLRALIRLLPEILATQEGEIEGTEVDDFNAFLSRVDKETLSQDRIKALQAAAGVDEIYKIIKEQIFPPAKSQGSTPRRKGAS